MLPFLTLIHLYKSELKPYNLDMEVIGDIPTTEAGLNEQINARERAEDIKKFWVGFEKWRGENRKSEIKLKYDLIKEVSKNPNEMWGDEEHDHAMEVLMLFKYGVKLMRDLYPDMKKNNPEPRVVFESEGNTFAVAGINDRFTYKVIDIYFVVNYLSLLGRKYGRSELTKEWVSENTHTVSEFLTDSIIMEIVSAGVEESAHAYFDKYKEGEKLEKAIDQYHKKSEQFIDKCIDEGYFAASPIYHSSDVERRALIWQIEIMKQYFPHWSRVGMEELVEKVREIRLKKSRKWFGLVGKK